MPRPLRRIPSPSLVISLVALFVSLGGVGYAAISANSVGTRQIKNNSIRTQDIRNNEIRGRDVRNSTLSGRDIAFNSITGDDVRESSLGEVPLASNALRLGGRDASEFTPTRPESVRLVGATGQPEFGTGFGVPQAADCADCLAPGFWKDPFGVVRLQGTVEGPASGTVFQLPDGYRPAGTVRAIVATQAGGGGNLGNAELAVDSHGVVTISSGDTLDFLDAVSFRAAG